MLADILPVAIIYVQPHVIPVTKVSSAAPVLVARAGISGSPSAFIRSDGEPLCNTAADDLPCRCLTTLEECTSYNLSRLPSCDRVGGPEVRTVARAAWLCLPIFRVHTTAGIAAHYITYEEPLYEEVEQISCSHVLEALLCLYLGEAGGVGHYLR